MESPTNNSSELSDHNLLMLQEVPGQDGGSVQHFICSDCMDLVERSEGSAEAHDCPALNLSGSGDSASG